MHMASKTLHAKKPREKSTVLKPLTETKKKVADALLDGATIKQAAAAVGLTPSSVDKMKTAKEVRSYMGNSQKQLQDALQVHRGDIVIALLSTAEKAELAADHGTMVRAYTEVAKMLGLYAPEVKQVNINMNQRAMLSKYEQMSDEELIQLTEGTVIEGESTRLQ